MQRAADTPQQNFILIVSIILITSIGLIASMGPVARLVHCPGAPICTGFMPAGRRLLPWLGLALLPKPPRESGRPKLRPRQACWQLPGVKCAPRRFPLRRTFPTGRLLPIAPAPDAPCYGRRECRVHCVAFQRFHRWICCHPPIPKPLARFG